MGYLGQARSLGLAGSDNVMVTEEGGLAIRLVNDTGASSVKGTVVAASTSVESAFDEVAADATNAIGVVYEDGIADGQSCWVAIQGRAQVLLEDSTASTVGYWVKVSDTQAGRADATNALHPGGTIAAIEDHLSEIGHCLESVTAGTDELAWCILHFN